jgi:hypothetical protein
MPDAATHTGKQVFLGEKAIADAYDEFDAAVIVSALNEVANRAPEPVVHQISASLNSLADRCKQRGVARGLRVAADHVRAGLWEDADNG